MSVAEDEDRASEIIIVRRGGGDLFPVYRNGNLGRYQRIRGMGARLVNGFHSLA